MSFSLDELNAAWRQHSSLQYFVFSSTRPAEFGKDVHSFLSHYLKTPNSSMELEDRRSLLSDATAEAFLEEHMKHTIWCNKHANKLHKTIRVFISMFSLTAALGRRQAACIVEFANKTVSEERNARRETHFHQISTHLHQHHISYSCFRSVGLLQELRRLWMALTSTSV